MNTVLLKRCPHVSQMVTRVLPCCFSAPPGGHVPDWQDRELVPKTLPAEQQAAGRQEGPRPACNHWAETLSLLP